MAADRAPLAIRFAGQDHALEPGRDHLLGSARDNDLDLGPAAAGHHARLKVGDHGAELVDLGSAAGTFRNGERIDRAEVHVGDTLRFGSVEAFIVEDLGRALVVPLPAMRAAAALRRTAPVRTAAAAMLRRREASTFGELMAGELRRGPWWLASAALHALLLVLLLWQPEPADETGGRPRFTFVLADDRQVPLGDSAAVVPEVTPEVAAPVFTDLPVAEAEAAPTAPMRDGADARDEPLRQNQRIARRAAVPGDRSGEALAVGSGGFQRTVADLRRSGLEIVFVFDSTGSMTRTIDDTKHSITQMLAVLRSLVPDARVGVVAYRDRGGKDSWVVRQVPLGTDYWRVANFVQSATAEGGGDRPEDVRSGLQAAFANPWRYEARRVVVLAGDAPPHAADQSRLLREVREFAQNGRSFVHTLVTSPDTAGQDTQEAFAAIAKAGRGTCADLGAHDRVLQRVLTLAFGREFQQDVAAVIRAADEALQRVDVQALDLARRGGPDLARALQEDPVPAPLLQALVRRPRRNVVASLIDDFGAANTPGHTRHAIAWVLQRALELPVPPLDPTSSERPGEGELARLRRGCAKLPD